MAGEDDFSRVVAALKASAVLAARAWSADYRLAMHTALVDWVPHPPGRISKPGSLPGADNSGGVETEE